MILNRSEDGKLQDSSPFETYSPHIFAGTDGQDHILVTTKEDNEVDTVDVYEEGGGSHVFMTTITPNILATINPGDLDTNDVEGAMLGFFDDYQEVVEEDTGGNEVSNSAEDEGMKRFLQEDVTDSHHGSTRNVRHRKLQSSSCSTYRVIEVGIVAEASFCSRFGPSSTQARSHIETIVARTSALYEGQGICARVRIKSLEINCNFSSNPYWDIVRKGEVASWCKGQNNDITNNFKNHYNRFGSKSGKDAVHLFFAKEHTSGTIGCAFTKTMCNSSWFYGTNNIGFSSNIIRQTALFAHELGHNAGLAHDNSSINNIMYSGLKNIDFFRFSAKSVNILKNNFNNRFQCLSTESSPTPTPPTNPGTSSLLMNRRYKDRVADLHENKNQNFQEVNMRNKRNYYHPAQRWYVDSMNRIHHVNSNYCLEAGVDGALYKKAYVYKCHNGKWQQWDFRSDGRIRNKHHGYYLGVAYCDEHPVYERLELRNYDTGSCGEAQRWYFTKA